MRITKQVRYWGVIAILMIGFCGATALMLAELRRESWATANTGARNLLTVLSQEIEGSIRTYDRTLATVVAKLETPGLGVLDAVLQQAFLFEGTLVEPYFTSLLVLDAAGNVVRDAGTSSAEYGNMGGRADFQAQALGEVEGLHISAPFRSEANGDDIVIGLSRRVEAADGSFAGIVLGTLRLSYFRMLIEQAQLEPGDAITLLSQDGLLLMRNPYRADEIGLDFSGTDHVDRLQREAAGAFTGSSAIDGVVRAYNFTRVGDLPLIANVALDYDGIFAAWRNQAAVMAIVLALLCLLTMALGFLVHREFGKRSRAEARTRRSEAQYRLLADNATDLILRLDGDLTRRYVSPAALAMLGYRPGEIVGRKAGDLVHPEDWPLVEDTVEVARATRSSAQASYRLKHRDGRDVWVEGPHSFVEEDGGFIVVLRDISLRKSAEQRLAVAHAELARRADTDGLTGLANRRRFDEALVEELDKAADTQAPVSLLLIDVDRFKLFNDDYGHPAGDACLRRVALAIGGCTRPSDLCARYGGEEISVILPGSDPASAQRVGERIRKAVEALGIAHAKSDSGRVTISIGCATAKSGSGENADALVERADRLLYEAKRTGRNKVAVDAMLEGGVELPRTESEPQRLAAVEAVSRNIAQRRSAGLDLVAHKAAELLENPIGFVSLVGHEELTLVGRLGIDTQTAPRDETFCTPTIAGSEPLVVDDARRDGRFGKAR